MSESKQPQPDPSLAAVAPSAAFARQIYLGTVAALLAHELNNLATPVLARSQDALDRDDVPAMRKALSVTVTQMQRINRLSESLIRVAQSETTGVASVSLHDAVQAAIAVLVRPTTKDGIELDVAVPGEIRVQADALLLEQVLLALLTLARQAIVDRKGRIRVVATVADMSVQIEVATSGRGLLDEYVRALDSVENSADLLPAADPLMLRVRVARMIAVAHRAEVSVLRLESGGYALRLSWPLAQ